VGLGTTDHRLPFHDSARGLQLPLLFPEAPTAMHTSADTHDTVDRKVPLVPGVGLGTTDHRLPFHDSARVFCPLLLPAAPPMGNPESPTAMHATGETHATPSSSLVVRARLGLGTTDQRVPSHDWTRVPEPLLSVKAPTAVHASAETQDTASRTFPAGRLGVCTTAQVRADAVAGSPAAAAEPAPATASSAEPAIEPRTISGFRMRNSLPPAER
jgi:hypothetical protein